MAIYNFHVGNVNLLNEALYNKKERNILIEGESLEDIDRRTALFSNFADIQEELNMFHTDKDAGVIIVDYDINDLSKSKIMRSDIVYMDDKKQLDNRDNIRLWALEYLRNNPYHIREFDGIMATFKNLFGSDDSNYTNDKVVYAVSAYFNNASYCDYRDVYFVLKYLNPPRVDKSNEIHK